MPLQECYLVNIQLLLSLTDSDIPEGVDPSFLAALPEQIRQEVIADQRRQRLQLEQQQAPAATGASSSSATASTSQADLASSEISPEFLAALPPAIQEEVLAQQRFEREQHQPANPDTPVDPANFFLTLTPTLRRQVLADMDDSQIALLPPDLQAEAQALRSELEHRHRQIQERFFTSQANSTLSRILRSAGTPIFFLISCPHASHCECFLFLPFTQGLKVVVLVIPIDTLFMPSPLTRTVVHGRGTFPLLGTPHRRALLLITFYHRVWPIATVPLLESLVVNCSTMKHCLVSSFYSLSMNQSSM